MTAAALPGRFHATRSHRCAPLRRESPTAMKYFADPVLETMATRKSVSKVGPKAPTDDELADLLAAVTRVADHKSLRPWRLILLRGDDRKKLADAFDAAEAKKRKKKGKGNTKPFRAELLIAVVASPKKHSSVPKWEQLATAAGAAHLLELALWRAGWGVFWRTGSLTNAPEVRKAHGLSKREQLLGWLYVGDISESYRARLDRSKRPPLDPWRFLGRMPD